MELVWPQAVRLTGPVDLAALDRAWRRLVARHDIARTRFPDRGDGQPERVVDPIGTEPDHVPVTDLRHLAAQDGARDAAAADLTASVTELVRAERAATVDLRQGPLLRCHIVRLPAAARCDGADEVTFVLVTGHSVVLDNWSVGVLWRDLGALYQAEAGDGHPDLPVICTSAAVHAARQANLVAGAGTAVWDRLARRHDGLPMTRLPCPEDRDGAVDDAEPVRFTVPTVDVRGLRERVGVGAASDFVLLLAAFAEAVADVLDQDDVVVGTSATGRTSDLYDTLGYFVNRIVVHVDRTTRRDLADVVCAVRRDVYAEIGGSALPFEHIVEHLHPDQYLTPAPLMDVMFVLTGAPPPLDFGAPAACIEPVAEPLDRFGLLLFAYPDTGGVAVQAHRAPARTRAADVSAILTRFIDIVAGAPLTVTAG